MCENEKRFHKLPLFFNELHRYQYLTPRGCELGRKQGLFPKEFLIIFDGDNHHSATTTVLTAFTSEPGGVIVTKAHGKAVGLELSGSFVDRNRELFELCLSLRKAALEPSSSTAAVSAFGEKKIGRELVWRKTLQAFSAKADRTFCAVLILCAEGFTEDTAMLARSLVELDVSLRYVSVDPQARVMEMLYEAERERKAELEATVKIRGLDQELKQALEEVEKSLTELERECGIEPDRWKKKSLWQKMKDAGLEDHYSVFRKFSGLVHPNPNKLMPYIRSSEIASQPFEVESAPRGENLDKILASAAAYFADILLIMQETAGLDTSELIGAHDRLKEHFERAAKSVARQRKATAGGD